MEVSIYIAQYTLIDDACVTKYLEDDFYTQFQLVKV